LDILAIYLRALIKDMPPNQLSRIFPYVQKYQPVQLRIDLLDLPIHSEADIYLALDHKSGGTKELPLDATADIAWDTLILLPASGVVQAVDSTGNPKPGLALQVMRDPVYDTITLSFNSGALNQASSGGLKGQLFTSLADSETIQDQSSPFSSDSTQPAPAQVIFAFWNTFPAYTPAQTLRRWDGAHTGPLGGRHGLYNLLRTASNQHIPMALLDLKTPTSLSALDYGEGLVTLLDIADKDLLILPERLPTTSLPGPLQAQLVSESRETGLDFGLPASQFIYAPLSEDLPSGYPIIFASDSPIQDRENSELTPVEITRWKDSLIIPVPETLPKDQATLSGPSLAVRRALIETAQYSPFHLLNLTPYQHPGAGWRFTPLKLGRAPTSKGDIRIPEGAPLDTVS
jgi:hypothetical protein